MPHTFADLITVSGAAIPRCPAALAPAGAGAFAPRFAAIEIVSLIFFTLTI